MRQPPVLHIAFGKLPSCGAQQMLARHRGPAEGQRHAILQLVAKSVGPAGLIEPGPRPDAAGQRLVQQPAVQHHIHRPVGRADLHRAQEVRPVPGDIGHERVDVGAADLGNQRAGRLGAVRLPDLEHQVHRGTGGQDDLPLQRRAGVKPRPAAARQRAAQAIGCIPAPGWAQKLHPAGGCGRPGPQIGKGNAAGKGQPPGVAGKHRAALVNFGHQKRCGGAACGAKHPFGIARDRQPAHPPGLVGQPDPADLDRGIQRDKLQNIAENALSTVLEPAVAKAVARHIGAPRADRQGGWGPEDAAVQILQIDRFARRV